MIRSLQKKIAAIIAVAALVFVPVLAPAYVSAADEIQDGVCKGVGLATGDGQDCSDNSSGEEGIQDAITNVINILSIIVGVVAVIMIIWGGLRYISSGGDSSRVGGAKNTIIYALLGLVIVAFAQFIVRFVLTNLGVN